MRARDDNFELFQLARRMRDWIVAHATDTSTGTTRRDFMLLATGAAGAVAAGSIVVPLISQLAPDAQTVAAGAPIDVDLTPVAEGQAIKLFWRGKLIFVRHRTKKEIDEAKAVDISTLRDPQTDEQRTKPGHEQYLIVFGNCTHLGCVPLGNAPGDPKGDLPRLALRFLRPHPQGPGAAQPAGSALCLHGGHQDQDRLSAALEAFRPDETALRHSS